MPRSYCAHAQSDMSICLSPMVLDTYSLNGVCIIQIGCLTLCFQSVSVTMITGNVIVFSWSRWSGMQVFQKLFWQILHFHCLNVIWWPSEKVGMGLEGALLSVWQEKMGIIKHVNRKGLDLSAHLSGLSSPTCCITGCCNAKFRTTTILTVLLGTKIGLFYTYIRPRASFSFTGTQIIFSMIKYNKYI